MEGGAAAALKRAVRWAYRLPFDLVEELSTGCANALLVNSRFTASVFDQAFPLLRGWRRLVGGSAPAVLHPCIDLSRNRQLAWPSAAPPVRLLSITSPHISPISPHISAYLP